MIPIAHDSSMAERWRHSFLPNWVILETFIARRAPHRARRVGQAERFHSSKVRSSSPMSTDLSWGQG